MEERGLETVTGSRAAPERPHIRDVPQDVNICTRLTVESDHQGPQLNLDAVVQWQAGEVCPRE